MNFDLEFYAVLTGMFITAWIILAGFTWLTHLIFKRLNKT